MAAGRRFAAILTATALAITLYASAFLSPRSGPKLPLPSKATVPSQVSHSVPMVDTSRQSAKKAGETPPTTEHQVVDQADSLEAALAAATRGRTHKFVLATFGNVGVKDHLLNFVLHASQAGAPHVVGAVDTATFDDLTKRGVPVYKTPLAKESYQLDGANQHSSGSWKRFAAMRTGEVAKMVDAGYSVMHTDCDVVWLRNPAPYLMCSGSEVTASGEWANGTRFPCAPMREADVAVSSDNMSPDRDTDGHASVSAGGTFNTGLLFIRATPNGRRFVREWHRLVVSPPRGSQFSTLTSDQQVFNHMMRKPLEWPGISAPRGAHVMDASDKSLRLGALPLALFMNGHGYFVQNAHKRLRTSPLAVHATYSLDNHDGVAKAQRFRESGLWLSDEQEYYSGKFLALNFSLPPAVQDAIDKYEQKGQSHNNIDVHSHALAAYMAELRDAIALAQVLKRILVLPRWTCYCDRMWSGSDDIFQFGCMYPGSQEGKFLPMVCPMDHLLSPGDWAKSKYPYRDASFLSSPRLPESLRKTVELQITPRSQFDALPQSKRSGVLPEGLTDQEAISLLSPLEGSAVLRLPHARGLMCGFQTSDATAAFNQLAKRLINVPQWCAKCYQPCSSELTKWLTPTEISAGGRGNFFCLAVSSPPEFRHGNCVRNV